MSEPLNRPTREEAEEIWHYLPTNSDERLKLRRFAFGYRALLDECEALQVRLKATTEHFSNLFGVQMHSFLGLVERDHEFKMENRRLLDECDSLHKQADRLAERLESALLQLPPDYCKTEGYAKCRAALAQYAARGSK